MVFVAPFIGAVTLFAGLVAGLPRPDSAVGGEVAVSAPNGVIESDTAELASQLSSESAATATWYPAATTAPAAAPTMYGGGYGYSPSASSSAYGSTVTYGSGSSNWGNSDGYNNCVQQCVASFGAPPATWTPSPTASSGSSDSGSGSGMTHTVIVAPTQGVLRYVPFIVNASVGDTVHFVWNANNHTVTKSSQLEICNKTSDAPFASGTQNKGFTFDQIVNDTQPTFFYCGTPGHCQQGMFGIINPPSVANANTSVGMQMSSLVSANPDLSAMDTYVNSQTASNQQASTWGQNIDLSAMPDWSHRYVAENVLYARSFMAQNPDVINQDGSINMNTNAPLLFPTDLTASNNAAAAPSSSGSSTAASSPTSSPSSTPSAAGSSSGAGRTAISSGLLAVAAIAASLLVL